MTNITHHINPTVVDPETWAQCPVCHHQFEQSSTGRRRVYCADKCRKAAFRLAKSATKLTETARAALVKQHTAIGNWRYTELPAWPHYTCLGCGQTIPTTKHGVTVPAWYDWNDWNQLAGVYRRVVCGDCHE